MKPASYVASAVLLSLALAGCGGLQKPSRSTAVNAPTFPQPQAAAAPVPADASTELPPPVTENRAFVMSAGVPQYRLGPGDVLEITVSRGPTQEKIQTAVRSGGTVRVILAETKVDG